MPAVHHEFPTMHAFTGALRESFGAMLDTIIREHGAGVRTFSAAIPSGSWRKRMIVASLHALKKKSIIITAHPVAQAGWIDMESPQRSELSEAAATLWSDQTAHMISALPYSCAPVLVLTDADIAPRSTTRSADDEMDRLVRHLVKHGYSLAFLDHTCCGSPWRSRLLASLASRLDLTIIHTSTMIEHGAGAHASHCAFTPRVFCRMAEAPLVREGHLLPYQHLLYCATPTAAERAFRLAAQQRYDALLTRLCPSDDAAVSFERWILETVEHLPDPGSDPGTLVLYRQSCPPLERAMFRMAIFLELVPARFRHFVPSVDVRPSEEDIVLLLTEFRDRVLRRVASPACMQASDDIDAFLRDDHGTAASAYDGDASATDDIGRLAGAGKILAREHAILVDRLRAIVIVDDPAPSVREFDPSKDDGLRVLASLVGDPLADTVHPVLLTGASLICHDDLVIPILSEIQKIINVNGWGIEVSHENHGDFSALIVEGGWDPGQYAVVAAQLFQRSITLCLIAPRSFISSGWENLTLNTVIDCTTRPGSWLPVQQIPPMIVPPEFPWRSVNYWDVVSIDPDLLTGYADWDRILEKHAWLDGPTGEGWIENGIGHVHDGFADPDGTAWATPQEDWNSVFMDRAGARLDVQRRWKVGQAFEGRYSCALDWRVAVEQAALPAPSLPQRRQLDIDLAAFHERLHAQQLRLTVATIAVIGAIISVFLLTDPMHAALESGAVLVAYLAFVFRWLLRTRTMKALVVPFGIASWIELLGNTLLAAMRGLPGAFNIPEGAGVEQRERHGGWLRMIFTKLDEADSRAAVSMLCEFFQPVADQEYFFEISGVDVRNTLLRTVTSPDRLERPILLLPVPRYFTRSTDGLKAILQAVQERCGSVVLRSQEELTARLEPIPRFPSVALQAVSMWH
jgi:hypothetical protein